MAYFARGVEMAKFCSECGSAISGKFCSECGAPLNLKPENSDGIAVEEGSNLTEINGVMVDIEALIARHGTGYAGRIEAIKELRRLTNVGLKEGKQIIDAACKGDPVVTSPIEKKGFWATVKEQADEANQKEAEEKRLLKERIAQMDREGVAYCPKCYSTSLSAHKKGFGIGKTVVGASLSLGNPIGLVAGNLGAKKIRVTCLKCGHQFMAGKK